METTLASVRPWPCEAYCDAPGCMARVDFALHFDGSPTRGLTTLYLCAKHKLETERRYNAKAAS